MVDKIFGTILKAQRHRYEVLRQFYLAGAAGLNGLNGVNKEQIKDDLICCAQKYNENNQIKDEFIENILDYLKNEGWIQDNHITAKGIDAFENYVLAHSQHS